MSQTNGAVAPAAAEELKPRAAAEFNIDLPSGAKAKILVELDVTIEDYLALVGVVSGQLPAKVAEVRGRVRPSSGLFLPKR